MSPQPSPQFPLPAFSRREIILAAAVFLSCFLGFYLLTDHVPAVRERVVDPLTRGQAAATVSILHAFGFKVEVDDTVIRSKDVSLNVKRGCDGILASAVLLAAVIAYPTSAAARAFGVVGGFLLLHLINLGRILSLFFVQTYSPSLFEKMHVAFWQALMILIAIFLWAVWERRWAFPARRANQARQAAQ